MLKLFYVQKGTSEGLDIIHGYYDLYMSWNSMPKNVPIFKKACKIERLAHSYHDLFFQLVF